MLTQKQEAFVAGIAKGLSQREAYRRAYNPKTMSEKTMDENACRLMKNSKVKARLDEINSKAMERTQVDVDKVRRKLIDIDMETATADITDFLIDKGHGELEFNPLGCKNTHAIKSIRLDKYGKICAIGLHDRTYAQEDLKKLLGIADGNAEESGVKIEIPDEYKDYLA